LTGAGSKASGARWNPPKSFATLDSSIDPATALGEAFAHHRYFGFPIEDALPRIMAAVRVELQHVLDLTDASIRKTLRVSVAELVNDDWHKLNRKGQEALTQAIGRLAWQAEWEGLLVPSAVADGKANLIIFPGNLIAPKSDLLLINRDQLPPPMS
jgi:RES domain-containing protein